MGHKNSYDLTHHISNPLMDWAKGTGIQINGIWYWHAPQSATALDVGQVHVGVVYE